MLTEAQVVALERQRATDEVHGEIETQHPGYLGSQDTYYVGTIKGIGRIYQLLVIVVGVTVTDYTAIQGQISYTTAMLLNIVWMYPIFHILHEGTHGALSSNKTLNNFIGQTALFFVWPEVTLKIFRLGHMQHHRHTNAPEDPDHYMFGSNWPSTIFRWMTFEFNYLVYTLKLKTNTSKKILSTAIPVALLALVVALGLCFLGYWKEVLMLWFIPSRIAMFLIGFAFLWLPHLGENKEGKLLHMTLADSSLDNLTAGSTMRLGHNRLMSVLLQWHHLHLIHHMWPTTPSYNHEKIWALLKPELTQRDLHVQHGFNLRPTFYPGGTLMPQAD